MPTKAIKRKRDDDFSRRQDLPPPEERAPSIVREEQMTPMRMMAMIAMIFVAVGTLALWFDQMGRTTLIGPSFGLMLLVAGLAGLLFHAAGEKEMLLRRVYGFFAAALAALGFLFSLLRLNGSMGGAFLIAGAPALGLALLFAMAYLRNETEEKFKKIGVFVIGGVGALLLVIGFLGGVVSESFLMGRGVVYLVLALFCIGAFITMYRGEEDLGYWAAFVLGGVGVIMMILALGKSLPFTQIPVLGDYLGWINGLFGWVRWPSGNPGSAFAFTYMGLEFLILAIGVCSDRQLIVMTRREMASYFQSPIGYIVLVVLVAVAFIQFWIFYVQIAQGSIPDPRRGVPGVPEPIVTTYFVGFPLAAIMVCIMVPVVTMRLLSEESRSGTLEVLLTSPVKESTVVISKFLAALRFFLLTFYSWGIYLLALRVEGGAPFDYRPVLTFGITLLVSGAAFISMGLFCSSLTRNQIGAAILSMLGMLLWLSVFVLSVIAGLQEMDMMADVLRIMSFYHLWQDGAQGILVPRILLFYVSAAVFWLFLTIKVLESRKWR